MVAIGQANTEEAASRGLISFPNRKTKGVGHLNGEMTLQSTTQVSIEQ